MKNTMTKIAAWFRRMNPLWQQRRYDHTLELLREAGIETERANALARSLKDENDALRADMARIADRAASTRYEQDSLGFYRVVVNISPMEFAYGGLSLDGRSVMAEHIGHRVAGEIRTARFVEPHDHLSVSVEQPR